jgi:DNA-binding transcriptional ArsR family regulator
MSIGALSDQNGGSGGTGSSHPLPDDLVELIADRFRALAEPTRIKLLDRLREGEATVRELTALVGTTQQNVSKHLNLLQHAGVVARRKQGNFAYYRIADETVYALCEAVCGSLENRFATLSRVTEAAEDWPRTAQLDYRPK